MSKRPVSDIEPNDSQESNKKPNIYTSQQHDESTIQSINQRADTTTNPSESQPSDQVASSSIQEAQNETISRAATQTGDQPLETPDDKGDVKSSDDSYVDSEDEADDSEWQDGYEYDFGFPEFCDFTFHCTDLGGSCGTFNCHRFVLASMSKYFETLFHDALKESKPSKCERGKKCQQPGHHCVSFKYRICGVEASVSDVEGFLCSLYAAFDGSGRSYAGLEKWREEGQDSEIVFLTHVVTVDSIQCKVTRQHWDFHGEYKETSTIYQNETTPKPGDAYFTQWETETVEYGLAVALQCDVLVKLYESNCIAIVDKALSLSNYCAYDLIWVLLGIADQHKFNALRNRCLDAVANDTGCRSREGWRGTAKTIERDTLTDSFVQAVEAQVD